MELNKILERDLKLACLIPTHCTGKASCSYCTSCTQAHDNRGCAQGAGHSAYTPLPAFCPFCGAWVGLPLPH